jgi:hypothetical protein
VEVTDIAGDFGSTANQYCSKRFPHMKKYILVFFLIGIWPAVSAQPPRNQCSGILHDDHGLLQFGGHAGEGEGICVVAESERSKVLRVCADGRFCRVSGKLSPCKDSGECEEIKAVNRVQPK